MHLYRTKHSCIVDDSKPVLLPFFHIKNCQWSGKVSAVAQKYLKQYQMQILYAISCLTVICNKVIYSFPLSCDSSERNSNNKSILKLTCIYSKNVEEITKVEI